MKIDEPVIFLLYNYNLHRMRIYIQNYVDNDIGCSLKIKNCLGKYGPAFSKILKNTFFGDTLYSVYYDKGAILSLRTNTKAPQR